MSGDLLFYIGLAVAIIIFVVVRHNNSKAVIEGRLGATDGAGNVAAVCFCFVVIAVLTFLLS